MGNEKRQTMVLGVKLTEFELAARAQELAAREASLCEAEREAEDQLEKARLDKKRHEGSVLEARDDVRRLALVVRERAEAREVEIAEVMDYEASAVRTVRKDTGEEVCVRAMRPGDRQVHLFPASEATV